MATLKELRNMVSAALDGLGADSYEARADKDTWECQWGSASVTIMVVGESDTDPMPGVAVSALIMSALVQNPLALYRKLLELNNVLGGSLAFSIDSTNLVWLTGGRFAGTIQSVDDLKKLILIVSQNADKYDDELIAEFGGALGDQS